MLSVLKNMQSDFLLLRGSLLHLCRLEIRIQSNNRSSCYLYEYSLLKNMRNNFLLQVGICCIFAINIFK